MGSRTYLNFMYVRVYARLLVTFNILHGCVKILVLFFYIVWISKWGLNHSIDIIYIHKNIDICMLITARFFGVQNESWHVHINDWAVIFRAIKLFDDRRVE